MYLAASVSVHCTRLLTFDGYFFRNNRSTDLSQSAAMLSLRGIKSFVFARQALHWIRVWARLNVQFSQDSTWPPSEKGLWDAKAIVTRSPAFSRALRPLHYFELVAISSLRCSSAQCLASVITLFFGLAIPKLTHLEQFSIKCRK